MIISNVLKNQIVKFELKGYINIAVEFEVIFPQRYNCNNEIIVCSTCNNLFKFYCSCYHSK
jgi:hypothetical protein